MNLVQGMFAVAALFAALPSIASADDVPVIVHFHGTADAGVLAQHGGAADLDLGSVKAIAGRIPAHRLRALRRHPGVASVEEDAVAHASDVPNDPHWATWNVYDQGLIRCPQAWDVAKGDGVRVAVLDTGAYLNHEDLVGKVDYKRNWTTKKSTDVTDINGHGSHTAGTVGANTNNGKGVSSPGRNCRLSIGKVLGNNGSGYYSWIIAGVNWAGQTGSSGGNARIISMSLGGASPSSALETAINNAWAANVIIVAAAGNSSSSSPEYPGAYANCVSVAAIDAITGTAASFTNYGPTVDVAAPGVDILSTSRTGGYVSYSGTSMATPLVAGVAALVLSTNLALSNATVRARLEGSLVDAVGTYPDGSLVRRIDALKSVNPSAP